LNRCGIPENNKSFNFGLSTTGYQLSKKRSLGNLIRAKERVFRLSAETVARTDEEYLKIIEIYCST
jgi:hypothetical protein